MDLLQTLRTHRYAVSGQTLADELGVSLRTVYRDIATLQSQGAAIDGEAGVGYVLKPGFLLPPLMFSLDELEALRLGALWVRDRGDGDLANAARNLLAKVRAILPEPLRRQLEATTLMVGRKAAVPTSQNSSASFLREAIRAERKVDLSYRDEQGRQTRRVIWPLGMGFFDDVLILIAWCELRNDLRHFRVDRVGDRVLLDETYPGSRSALIAEWKARQGISVEFD